MCFRRFCSWLSYGKLSKPPASSAKGVEFCSHDSSLTSPGPHSDLASGLSEISWTSSSEVSPSLSENSGRSRTPTRSGVCGWVKMEVWPCLIQVETFCFWSLLVVLTQWFRMLLGSLDPVTLEFMLVWSFCQLNVRPISSWRTLVRDLPVVRIHRSWFRYTFLFPVLGVALCWTYPRKTGNLLRMRISGFLIIARDMFLISRAWAMCVVLWLWNFRKQTFFGQTRDWRSFWLTTTCKSLRIVLHVPWVWWLVRVSLLVKSFALHVRIRYLPQVLKRVFSVSVLRTTLHWIRSTIRWRKDTHISLPDSIVVPLHFVGLINRKKHRVFVCHWLQFAFHVSSLTSGKHSFLFELNRSVEFACLHGSQRIQGHLIVRHSLHWRLH